MINNFIEKSNIKHNNKFDYSLVEYVNSRTKVKIICPIHGIFEQTPDAHSRNGCYLCNKYKKLDKLLFIEKAKEIHSDKYDYSLVEYVNNRTKVKIICPIHGEFEQTPLNHINHKNGCKFCSNKIKNLNKKSNKDEFINKSKEIHGDKYDYTSVEYINSHKSVMIICKKHGIFEQKPYSHLNGIGCPNCNRSKGEEIIETYLLKNNINFEKQKTFNDCFNKYKLRFDFYLPDYNICIEFNGIQHYKEIKYFGGKEKFILNINRFNIKKNYCINNNINLYIIKYNDNIIDKLNLLFYQKL